FRFPSGGFFSDPSSYVSAEVAAGAPVQLGWSAEPVPGSFIRGYRWALDIASLDDETPRADEALDLRHWSPMSPATATALPAFSPASAAGTETHFFYLEAEDDLGLLSLGVLRFTVVRPTFDRPLLVVDDTWFTPDRFGSGGCVAAPRGEWPTA